MKAKHRAPRVNPVDINPALRDMMLVELAKAEAEVLEAEKDYQVAKFHYDFHRIRHDVSRKFIDENAVAIAEAGA